MQIIQFITIHLPLLTIRKAGLQEILVSQPNDVIQKAKSVCKDIGFKLETQRFDDCAVDLLKISDSFELARTQEYILSKK